MARIERRPRARSDLLSIFTCIADQSGEARAEQSLRKLGATLATLAQQPLMGRARPELGEGIRSFPFDGYIAFYLAFDDGIDLVRVIHAKLDLERVWTDNDPVNAGR